ncbi:hypothetical protein ACIPSA_26945 [Streptomyces sp. NPDC086549]|uniref:hypothetical protein n=1 Tax=Streptomyces sp. NPDC086549 TaxID=3365752 RepID=UPI00382ADEAC
MSLRDFLERFQPTGTPGAAATGVPADRAAERAAESGPPLAQVTEAQQETSRAAGPTRARLAVSGPALDLDVPGLRLLLADAHADGEHAFGVVGPEVVLVGPAREG